MKNWQKVMGVCDQSWNFSNFTHGFDQICALFANIRKFSIGLESPHFPTFSAKCRECRIE